MAEQRVTPMLKCSPDSRWRNSSPLKASKVRNETTIACKGKISPNKRNRRREVDFFIWARKVGISNLQ